MKTVEINNEENSISIDDQYYETDFNFFPEDKKFTASKSVKHDCFYNHDTIEYKISVDPVGINMRILERSSEPPLEYSIKDGVVLESELKKNSFISLNRIESLKEDVKWSKVSLFGNYEVNLFILSRHPEIISKDSFRKFLREAEQRIKTSLIEVERKLKENNNTGLQIIEGEYGKQIYYPNIKEISKKDQEKKFKYIEDKFYAPLFDEKSSEYCGVSRDEFGESSEILKYIDKLLNEKEDAGSKIDNDEAKKKNYWDWIRYIWTFIVNIIAVVIVLSIYGAVYKKFEIIVVSILILIYLSLQSFIMFYGRTITENIFFLDTEFKRIRKLLKDEPNKYEKEEIQEAKKKVDKASIKMYINAAFLFVIYLIALFNLFSAL